MKSSNLILLQILKILFITEIKKLPYLIEWDFIKTINNNIFKKDKNFNVKGVEVDVKLKKIRNYEDIELIYENNEIILNYKNNIISLMYLTRIACDPYLDNIIIKINNKDFFFNNPDEIDFQKQIINDFLKVSSLRILLSNEDFNYSYFLVFYKITKDRPDYYYLYKFLDQNVED